MKMRRKKENKVNLVLTLKQCASNCITLLLCLYCKKERTKELTEDEYELLG
jgi:hypothetical protein